MGLIPVIPALRKLGHQDLEFKINLCSTEGQSQKNKIKSENKKKIEVGNLAQGLRALELLQTIVVEFLTSISGL